jgi:hypothetical protein
MLRLFACAAIACLAWSQGGAAEITIAGNQVLLTGRITEDEYHHFRRALERNPTPVDTVILRGSPGGIVAAAESIMTVIWNRGMTTAISGPCSSSCALIFLGGKRRQFTDEQPVGHTYLMYHGCYTTDGYGGGTVRWNHVCSRQIEKTIREYTDNRLNEDLLRRWINVPNNLGGVFFFDSNRLKRSDRISAFFCPGDEKKRYDDCERLGGVDAYRLGLITSTELVKVHPDLALKPAAQQ